MEQNGTKRVQLYDAWDRPVERDLGDFKLPPVVQFNSIVGGYAHTYYHGRYDEAIRFGRADAVGMRRDCFIMGLLQERKLAVASLKWHLEIPDEKDQYQRFVRDTITQIVSGINGLQDLIYCLLEAIWYGRYGVEIRWEYQPWGKIKGGRAFTVKKWSPVNGDKIGYQWGDTPYILVNAAEISQIPEAREYTINATIGRALLLDGPWREFFVIHHHERDDADYFEAENADAIHGVGIRSRIFWLQWVRQEYLAWITSYLERVGLGVALWHYDMSNPASHAAVQKASLDQSNRVNILVPTQPDGKGGFLKGAYERVETPVAGVDALRQLVEGFCEQHIERYVVGQSLSSKSEGEGLGGSGVADLHSATKSKIAAMDAARLAGTLTGTDENPGLISVIKRWTFPDADFPVTWQFDVDNPESVQKLGAVSTLVGLGLKVKADDARAAAGFAKPAEGDEVVTPPQQPGMPGAEGEESPPEGDEEPDGDPQERADLEKSIMENLDDHYAADDDDEVWQYIHVEMQKERGDPLNKKWMNTKTGEVSYGPTMPGDLQAERTSKNGKKFTPAGRGTKGHTAQSFIDSVDTMPRAERVRNVRHMTIKEMRTLRERTGGESLPKRAKKGEHVAATLMAQKDANDKNIGVDLTHEKTPGPTVATAQGKSPAKPQAAQAEPVNLRADHESKLALKRFAEDSHKAAIEHRLPESHVEKLRAEKDAAHADSETALEKWRHAQAAPILDEEHQAANSPIAEPAAAAGAPAGELMEADRAERSPIAQAAVATPPRPVVPETKPDEPAQDSQPAEPSPDMTDSEKELWANRQPMSARQRSSSEPAAAKMREQRLAQQAAAASARASQPAQQPDPAPTADLQKNHDTAQDAFIAARNAFQNGEISKDEYLKKAKESNAAYFALKDSKHQQQSATPNGDAQQPASAPTVDLEKDYETAQAASSEARKAYHAGKLSKDEYLDKADKANDAYFAFKDSKQQRPVAKPAASQPAERSTVEQPLASQQSVPAKPLPSEAATDGRKAVDAPSDPAVIAGEKWAKEQGMPGLRETAERYLAAGKDAETFARDSAGMMHSDQDRAVVAAYFNAIKQQQPQKQEKPAEKPSESIGATAAPAEPGSVAEPVEQPVAGQWSKHVSTDVDLDKAQKDVAGLVVPFRARKNGDGSYEVSQDRVKPLGDKAEVKQVDLENLIREMWDKGYAVGDYAPENMAYVDGKLQLLDLDSFQNKDDSGFNSPEELVKHAQKYYGWSEVDQTPPANQAVPEVQDGEKSASEAGTGPASQPKAAGEPGVLREDVPADSGQGAETARTGTSETGGDEGEASRRTSPVTAEERELHARLRSDDTKVQDQAKNDLVKKLFDPSKPDKNFVAKIANGYRDKGVDVDDLIGAGLVGLAEAIDGWDPEKGAFITRAGSYIHGAIKKALDEKDTISKPDKQKDAIPHVQAEIDRLKDKLGREPTPEEIGKDKGIAERARQAGSKPAVFVQSVLDAMKVKMTGQGTNEEGESPLESVHDRILRPDQEIERRNTEKDEQNVNEAFVRKMHDALEHEEFDATVGGKKDKAGNKKAQMSLGDLVRAAAGLDSPKRSNMWLADKLGITDAGIGQRIKKALQSLRDWGQEDVADELAKRIKPGGIGPKAEAPAEAETHANKVIGILEGSEPLTKQQILDGLVEKGVKDPQQQQQAIDDALQQKSIRKRGDKFEIGDLAAMEAQGGGEAGATGNVPSREQLSPAAQNLYDHVGKQIDAHTHLPKEKLEELHQAHRQIFARMSDGMVKAVGEPNLVAHNNVEDLTNELARIHKDDPTFKDIKARGNVVAGGYSPKHRRVDVDGPAKMVGGDPATTRRILAHEWMHAANHDEKYSILPAWGGEGGAWETEINGDPEKPLLTKYGQRNANEGMSAFAELLIGTDTPHKEIEAKFPKCAAFFKQHGLWPGSEGGGGDGREPAAPTGGEGGGGLQAMEGKRPKKQQYTPEQIKDMGERLRRHGTSEDTIEAFLRIPSHAEKVLASFDEKSPEKANGTGTVSAIPSPGDGGWHNWTGRHAEFAKHWQNQLRDAGKKNAPAANPAYRPSAAKADAKTKAWAQSAMSFINDYSRNNPMTDLDFATLYHKNAKPAGLSIEQFHDGLLLLNKDKKVDLKEWTIDTGILMDKGGELALPQGLELRFFVQPKSRGLHAMEADKIKTDVESEFKRLLNDKYKSEGPGTISGQVPIHELRDWVAKKYGQEAASHAQFDKLIKKMRNDGVFEFTTVSDMRRLSPQQHEKSIQGEGETFGYLEPKEEQDFNFDSAS